jgi:hypothetical protein
MADGEQEHGRSIAAALARPLALSAAGLLALAGCGSSGSTAPTATVQATHVKAQRGRPTPRESNADIGTERAQRSADKRAILGSNKVGHKRAIIGRDPVERAGKVQKGAIGPRTADVAPSAKPINPCALVTATQARSLTSGAVSGASEAPLGPTCVYTLAHSKTNITMAIEFQSFSQVTGKMKNRQRLSVDRRQAYCGRLGTEMVFVELPQGRVLNVTAPCTTAQRFATEAITHLVTRQY